MISVPFPHMALNSSDVPGPDYLMWNTWKVDSSTSVQQMVDGIARVASGAPGGSLSTLILNSHGSPGKIWMGVGITLSDVEKFNAIKGLVDRIWIVACRVAFIQNAGTVKDGNYFCYRLAQESGCYVKAGTAYQDVGAGDWIKLVTKRYGFIDEWEGTYYTWNPKGELILVENDDDD